MKRLCKHSVKDKENQSRQSQVVATDETTQKYPHDSVVQKFRCQQHCTNPQQAAFQRQCRIHSVRIRVIPFLQPTTHSNSIQTQHRLPSRRGPTAQSRAPCRLLGMSRDKLCPLELSRLLIPIVHSLRKANQRSISSLEINEYQHRLRYKTAISDVLAVRLHVQLAGFSSSSVSLGLRIHRTEQ